MEEILIDTRQHKKYKLGNKKLNNRKLIRLSRNLNTKTSTIESKNVYFLSKV